MSKAHQKPAKSVSRLEHWHLVCLVVNFFINNTDIKPLPKSIARVNMLIKIWQAARHAEMLLFYVT